MPRMYDILGESSRSGTVEVVSVSSSSIDVLYSPPERVLKIANRPEGSIADTHVKVLHIDAQSQRLTMFPTRTSDSMAPAGFLLPRYNKIDAITIEGWDVTEADVGQIITWYREDPNNTDGDTVGSNNERDTMFVIEVLEALPSCFVKDYDYALGFTRRYGFMIEIIERLSDCSEIVISNDRSTGVDGAYFCISLTDFRQILRTVERHITISQESARTLNRAVVRNLLAERTGDVFIPVRLGRSPLRKHIIEAATTGESLSINDQETVLTLLAQHTESIAAVRPTKLTALKNDIELVTLDHLIADYETMIKVKHPESHWQEFFNANPFILSLAFGYPILKVAGQASVGGHKLLGTGETITDFLVKNNLTNNASIIEIKTPQTRLLAKKPYRNGVYAPSTELVGAVNQVLSQKYHFEQEIAQIKSNSKIYDLESHSVYCNLIVGLLPDTDEEKASFELFRGNSKDVGIITFDELLEKLKILKQLLESPNPVASTGHGPSDLPF